MAKRLTKKQRAFVNEFADTGNGTQSVIKAGYNVTSKDSAAVLAIETLSSNRVQEELKKLGFDTNNAKRVVSEILNKEHAEDRDRLKAAETVFKVQGDFAPEKHVTLNIDVEPTERVTSILSRLTNRGGKETVN